MDLQELRDWLIERATLFDALTYEQKYQAITATYKMYHKALDVGDRDEAIKQDLLIDIITGRVDLDKYIEENISRTYDA